MAQMNNNAGLQIRKSLVRIERGRCGGCQLPLLAQLLLPVTFHRSDSDSFVGFHAGSSEAVEEVVQR